MAAYGSGVILALEFVSLSGMVSNSVSIWHILKHFNVEKTVFLLLLVDAVVSFTGCFVSFCFGLFLHFFTFPCTVIPMCAFVTNAVGFATMMEISVIRFYSLKESMRNLQIDEKRMQRLALILLTVISCYPIAFWLYFIINNIPRSNLIETCIHGDPKVLPSITLYFTLVIPSILIHPVISIIFDSAIIWTLRKKPKDGITCSMDTIPVRVTLLSTASLLAPLLCSIFLHISWASKMTSSVATLLTEIIVIAGRCPLATFVCYAHKSKREYQSRRLARESRLKKVLLHAREERMLRNMRLHPVHV